MRTPLAPVETGCAETAAEFARRVRGRFVLRGPREQMVGGDGETTPTTTQNTTPSARDELVLPGNSDDNPAEREFPLTFLDEDNIVGEIKGQYDQDSFFKLILEAPEHYCNFEVRDGYIRLRTKEHSVLCIPKLVIDGRNVREHLIEQVHSLLAHLGTAKTLTYLREHLWWKDLATDVRKYCESCATCKRSKPSNQRPYGLLNPLDVPSKPWESIGIDFVGPLPLSKDRDGEYNSITVVIDRLTGMVHLVPGRVDYTAREVAELVFAEVYKHHGLPRMIVSDRDALFTSAFWTRLKQLISVQQCLSSTYHPQTDGSTERANRTIGHMLQACISPNQRDWVARLPAIEFAINSSRSETTGYAPFFLNSGRMPRSFIWNNPSKDEYPSVRVFAQRLKQAIIKAHNVILEARVKQTRTANRKRQVSPFKVKDLTYVSTKNMSLPKEHTRKLAPKFIGPYEIISDYGNNSYKLDLPTHLKQRGIHPVFHASLLRIHVPNDNRLFPGRQEIQVADFGEGDREWQVDQILSHVGSGPTATFEVK